MPFIKAYEKNFHHPHFCGFDFMHRGFTAGLNDEPFEAESQNDDKLTNLQGTWFCVRTDVVAPDRREELDFENELKNYKENMELNVFKFTKGSFVMGTRSEHHSIMNTKWSFVPSNRINFPKMEEGWSFVINYLNKDSMNLDIIPRLRQVQMA
ncbi:hypothetical protein [Niabella ginsengisoli]|uniref:Uncharacterized protein n=1 Tax=Niabella ginsengisoli TaxID=522298 RepID=A0ABS9SRC6_9BACT|nr:hypothetical protein [Niabella ginsengisoli]MCH5600905.1 hypothetical protein [Niabella ginsengisoli]